jgi:hypothetical protein
MDYVQDIVNTKERKGTETAKLTEKRKKKKKALLYKILHSSCDDTYNLKVKWSVTYPYILRYEFSVKSSFSYNCMHTS